MARTRRSELPDGPFHVIAHAVAREPLFWSDVDRKVYLGLLQQTIETYDWRLLTFVLMGNHVHLLIVCATSDLSGGLWWLHWQYAEHVRRRFPERRGYIFESRPKTPPIKDERYLLAVLRYIANNPVKAGLCSRPEEFRWSAHRAILGLSPALPTLATEEILPLFSRDPILARGKYAAFIHGDDPVEEKDIRRWAERAPAERPPLTELLGPGDAVEAIRSAHVKWGYSMRAIARTLGVNPATISRRIRGG